MKASLEVKGDNFDLRKNQTVQFMKEKMIDNDQRDKEVWEHITNVPQLKSPWQYICFVLNVIIPGSGTMICSCFYKQWSKTLFMVGVFQLFLAYILIGWIFSIYWGVLIVRKSWQDKDEMELFMNKTNIRSDQEK
mmetsp:Transcript_1605/g.1545  ORF Transcript_1605/g.1545 Transcript_1605/m.1545 type:complete len:135 (+) Transcript_1605:43-447(+)|eukprot:CAMPEP_0170555964 /NCGR_PEP_ID=MMETSP0211-20121228/14894_1 /TAXON_ID=311385 /ORGANISM="Pseudokeronopsis sp., Strain OXSARD2" /LENGTH=134 /DNA_ID=CAMNT_0010866015 /DNA_START=26 /DNA_END=430 /DNA_ORIENTATION=-